jgi:hypothetical protein
MMVRDVLTIFGLCDILTTRNRAKSPGAVQAPRKDQHITTACPRKDRLFAFRGTRSRMTKGTSIGSITTKDVRIILSLRLLIARAANADSLAWWDDESLTPHAGFLLERLFPRAPSLAARSLALRAALARHQAACAHHEGALHLYRLDVDSRDELVLRFEPLLPIPAPDRRSRRQTHCASICWT